MFFTGDNDTRVDPLHARKMTPCCNRPPPANGPSSSITVFLEATPPGCVEQQIQDDADELTFLWTETAQPASHP